MASDATVRRKRAQSFCTRGDRQCLKLSIIDRRRFLAAAVTLRPLSSACRSSGAKASKTASCPQSAAGDTSFGPLKQIDAGVLNVGYAEAGPADGPAVILLHGWPYDIHSFVDVAPLLASAGYRVIVPLSARLRHDALSFERHGPQRPAVGARRRHHRADGCAQDREGDPRRLRLGRAHGQHRRGALAGALQGPGLGERLSDRQPGGRQGAAAAQGRAAMVVPVLLRHRTRPRRLRQVPARLRQAHLADSPRRSGTSTTPRSIAAPRPSTIRITSPS